MPLLHVNALGCHVALADAPGPLGTALGAALAATPRGRPAVILVHGFRYAPSGGRANPHRTILAARPAAGIAWPRHLHLDRPGAPLGIGFGWTATGTIWQAWAESDRAARALAQLVALIGTLDPDRPVAILGHSLGARVALRMLHHLPAPPARLRLLLLAGAAFRHEAEAALATAAGRTAEVVNVLSRENDLFDFLVETAVSGLSAQALGHGLGRKLPGWIDLQIDHPDVCRGLGTLGFRIAPADRRICHWSVYRRPGLFALYRALACAPEPLALSRLAQALPDAPAPRWSRLLARIAAADPLPDGAEPS